MVIQMDSHHSYLGSQRKPCRGCLHECQRANSCFVTLQDPRDIEATTRDVINKAEVRSQKMRSRSSLKVGAGPLTTGRGVLTEYGVTGIVMSSRWTSRLLEYRAVVTVCLDTRSEEFPIRAGSGCQRANHSRPAHACASMIQGLQAQLRADARARSSYSLRQPGGGPQAIRAPHG